MKLLAYLFRVLILCVFWVALLFGLAFVALMALRLPFDRELQRIIHKTQGHNIEINFLDYGEIRLSRLGIVLKQVRARGVTRIKHPYFEAREFDMSIPRVRVGLQNFTWKSFEISAEISGGTIKGGRVFNEDSEDRERLEAVNEIDFKFVFPLEASPRLWKTQLFERAKQVKLWAFDDQLLKNLESKGTAVFIVDDWPVSVRFYSVADSDGFVHLEGNAEDFRVIAEMIEPKFTDSDLNLAARNLLKTPRLLSIRTKAEAQAMRLKGREAQIAYDVPRHIYWSYYLTEAYGADFARKATDAHETGDELNSAAESNKDRRHNALGIEYAQKKLSESEVEKLIFKDPRVLRFKTQTSATTPADQAAVQVSSVTFSHVL